LSLSNAEGDRTGVKTFEYDPASHANRSHFFVARGKFVRRPVSPQGGGHRRLFDLSENAKTDERTAAVFTALDRFASQTQVAGFGHYRLIPAILWQRRGRRRGLARSN
jgi:hypothetical protein